jgi:uncharacterized DUF497 family protein
MNGDGFEWDDAKAIINLKKHKISFDTARHVFTDPDLFVAFDSGPYGEQRFQAIGIVNAVLISVFYTERGDNIRIISARKATKHEQRTYYQGQKA